MPNRAKRTTLDPASSSIVQHKVQRAVQLSSLRQFTFQNVPRNHLLRAQNTPLKKTKRRPEHTAYRPEHTACLGLGMGSSLEKPQNGHHKKDTFEDSQQRNSSRIVPSEATLNPQFHDLWESDLEQTAWILITNTMFKSCNPRQCRSCKKQHECNANISNSAQR